MDPGQFLPRVSGYSFYNTAKLDMKKLMADPNNIKLNLLGYIASFSPNVADIFEEALIYLTN